jgi:HEPN domain-containing protein
MNSKVELTKEWLKKAERDLDVAKLTLENKPEYTDAICFHCQQAVEKYLKALLVYLNVDFEKTHHLPYLLDLLNEKLEIKDDIYEIAESLDSYAVEVRYPDDWFEPSKEDAEKAFEMAIEIKKFVLGKLNFQ